jgi:hypothetical protein
MSSKNKFDFTDFVIKHTALFIGRTVALFIGVIFIISCFRLNTGEKQYTGYIYSAEDTLFQTVGHLRFSENAGMDEQPAFCVDKGNGQKIKDLAGTGKKVKVTVPAGFKVVLPFFCAFPAEIEEMGE